MNARTTHAVSRFEASQGPRIVGPRDGEYVDLGALGVRFMVWSGESGGGVSLVEHPIPPGSLCAPLHRHGNEDEFDMPSIERICAEHGLTHPLLDQVPE